MFLFHNYTQQSMKIQLVLSLEVETSDFVCRTSFETCDEFFWVLSVMLNVMLDEMRF